MFFIFCTWTLFNLSNSLANIIYTIDNGNWLDSTTWSESRIPLSTDSIFIYHYVTFSEKIQIDSSGLLQIDSIGTLCGHGCIKIQCGGYFFNYNVVMADTLLITDGGNYGSILYLDMFMVAPCIQVFWTGQSQGGYPFDCDSFEPSFIENLENDSDGRNNFDLEIEIYPNPFQATFTIDCHTPIGIFAKIIVYDILGKQIDSFLLYSGNSTNRYSTDLWVPGVYLVTILTDDKLIKTHLVQKLP